MRRLISDPQQSDAQYLIGTIAKYVSHVYSSSIDKWKEYRKYLKPLILLLKNTKWTVCKT